jgi:hypothetical protein
MLNECTCKEGTDREKRNAYILPEKNRRIHVGKTIGSTDKVTFVYTLEIVGIQNKGNPKHFYTC